MADLDPPTSRRDGDFAGNDGQAAAPRGAAAGAAARAGLPASLLLPKGFAIEEFRIEAALGIGGFGITYLAHDVRGLRRVALKEYMPEALVAGRDLESRRPIFRSAADRADFENFLHRFRDEALNIARFNHPNIVPIHRVLAGNGTAYIVMEYLGEVSLQRLVGAGRQLGEAALAHLLAGVLDGLGAMHAAGLLHRDVKPSNIMLRAPKAGEGVTPVLIDFGSVRRAHYEGEPASLRVVSEGYSPPEQYDADGEIGPWSDIFALAATLYFALRGAPPAPVVDRILALMRGKPDPLVALTPATTGGLYSAPFLAAVALGLELQERARPQSVAEWATLFPAPICRKHYPAARVLPARAATPAPAAPSGDIGDDRAESPATLLAGAGTPPRARRRPNPRAVLGAVRIAPAHPRETRMRVLGQLAAFALILAGATVAVGVATEDIGPPRPRQVADGTATGAVPAGAQAAAAAMRAPVRPPSADAARCDALAAHPDDPGKPANVPGVAFDAIGEAAAREALEACAAALRADAADLRARFNLGRAAQRLARLRPAEGAEFWRRAGAAYRAPAERGYAAAQGNLGQMLYAGLGGLGQDDAQAVDWLAKAARGNFADAYLTLAHAYATGRGVAQADARKSYCWLTLVERTSTVHAYKSFARQQRAAMLLGAAAKRAIDDGAAKGADCL